MDILLAMAPPASGEEQGGAMWLQCLFPLAFLGIFYALLIRPQQQQQKQMQNHENIKKSRIPPINNFLLRVLPVK